jgi:predicted MFS family arabinose efflux permease
MRDFWRTPAGRGSIMLAIMTFTFGFAYSAQNNVVTNYFNDVLHLSGPQFGYITAIREVGGFVLIFLTALFYRVSLQKLTAGALIVLAVGYALFSLSVDFRTVIPWVVLTSFGLHTVLQTQTYLGMSLTTAARSGAILGRISAVSQAGTFAALLLVFFSFRFDWLSFRPTFILVGGVTLIGVLAIFRFPHLQDGVLTRIAPKREPIVWRRDYRYYYWLCLLDGARQQVFFSFGLWVLVNRFGLEVDEISLVLLVVTFASMISAAWIGRAIDKYGERRSISVVNLAYIVALVGYALSGNVLLAAFFYLVYAVIAPVSSIGASTYLRKIALPKDLAPSLAMGVTIFHATAIAVPVAAGFILNFVGYQVPFLAACAFALAASAVTLRLDPVKQRCRVAEESGTNGEPPRPNAETGQSPS